MVAQALISAIKAPAKMILRECCSFMVAILPRGNVTRQAQIAAKRSVAKSFEFEVEKLCGADTATTFLNGKTKLVEAKLEMVRSRWLLQYGGVVHRFCWFSGLDRIQRSKIDRCLQRRLGQSKGAPSGRRSPRFACH